MTATQPGTVEAVGVASLRVPLPSPLVLGDWVMTHRALALVAVRTLRVEYAARARQVKAARNAARLSRARYDAGVVDYLEVLDTERTLFNSELAESETRFFIDGEDHVFDFVRDEGGAVSAIDLEIQGMVLRLKRVE